MAPLDPSRFTVRREAVRNGVRLAFVHEGVGGYPILLIHGYPETKRIWWRNVASLAAAGFEVIAPDLRGVGDSDLAADGFYDIAAYSMDLYALVHDVLGHEQCVIVGGDVGGVVLCDLVGRYPGFAVRLAFFDTIVPLRGELFDAAGIPPEPARDMRPTADYFVRQGRDADALLAELDTADRRRAWVADMYGHRLWASPGQFSPADIEFMTEPFTDAARLRASWGVYETAFGARPMEDAPRVGDPISIPTLALYGADDHVVDASFPDRCRVAFTECIGPFVLRGCGHFVQWEAADTLNTTLRWCCADLLER
ncbi:MAG TPA: alpha/beta hydrolase [Acidimicrobiia bacterium]|nr:alpha/beta hydrolase [Acidimicrobiia bacterium]